MGYLLTSSHLAWQHSLFHPYTCMCMYKHLWDSTPGLSVRFGRGKGNIIDFIKFTNANVISRSDCTGILLIPAMSRLRWFLVGISIDICHVWGGSHKDSRLLLSTRPLRPLDFCVTSLNKLTFVLKENTPCSLSLFDSVYEPSSFEFFSVNTKLAEMAILASKDLTAVKKLPPVGLDLMLKIITVLGVLCLTN